MLQVQISAVCYQMGQHSPNQFTPFLSKRKSTLLLWAFKLHSAPAAVEIWQLKALALKVNLSALEFGI
jgi:hypothetical protein